MTETTQQRLAFVAVVAPKGFGIGVAERDLPGYWPVNGHGTFPTYEAASRRAEELNAEKGLAPEDAAAIVCSSMFPKNAKPVRVKKGGR